MKIIHTTVKLNPRETTAWRNACFTDFATPVQRHFAKILMETVDHWLLRHPGLQDTGMSVHGSDGKLIEVRKV